LGVGKWGFGFGIVKEQGEIDMKGLTKEEEERMTVGEEW